MQTENDLMHGMYEPMLFMLIVEASILLGFLLDLVLGDPERFPHPVIIIGKGISFLEKSLRTIFPDRAEGRRAAGVVMAILIPLSTFVVSAGICVTAWIVHPLLFFAAHTMWCWQAIAVRGLEREAKNVYRCLCEGGELDDTRLAAARKAVGRIVGRDTAALDEKGVIRATVETVAENFSDGVVAPLFYMAIGGAPLALTYKSINTMDSMVGYKNDKYVDFGRAAARLDDAAGWIPARIGALIWIFVAGMFERRMKQSYVIWKRDRRNHASPNAAQTEAACAGALGVQLAGPAYYFGEFYDKPVIGDPDRDIEAEDILRTCRMMRGASVFGVLLCMMVVAIPATVMSIYR